MEIEKVENGYIVTVDGKRHIYDELDGVLRLALFVFEERAEYDMRLYGKVTVERERP